MAAIGERLLVFNGGSLELISQSAERKFIVNSDFQATETSNTLTLNITNVLKNTDNSGQEGSINVTTAINMTADEIKLNGNTRINGDLFITGEINQETVNNLHVNDLYILLNVPEEGSAPSDPSESGVVVLTSEGWNGDGKPADTNPAILWLGSANQWVLRKQGETTTHVIAYDPFLRKIRAGATTIDLSDQNPADGLSATVTFKGDTNITTSVVSGENEAFVNITLNNTLTKLEAIELNAVDTPKIIISTKADDYNNGRGLITLTPPSGEETSQPVIAVNVSNNIIPATCPQLNADMVDGHHATDFASSNYEYFYHKTTETIEAGNTISAIKIPDDATFVAVFVNGRYLIPDGKNDSTGGNYNQPWAPGDNLPHDWTRSTTDGSLILHFDVPADTWIVAIVNRKPNA